MNILLENKVWIRKRRQDNSEVSGVCCGSFCSCSTRQKPVMPHTLYREGTKMTRTTTTNEESSRSLRTRSRATTTTRQVMTSVLDIRQERWTANGTWWYLPKRWESCWSGQQQQREQPPPSLPTVFPSPSSLFSPPSIGSTVLPSVQQPVLRQEAALGNLRAIVKGSFAKTTQQLLPSVFYYQ